MSSFPLPQRIKPWTWLRNSMLTGVALVLPFVLTAWLIWIVVSFIDYTVQPLFPPALRPMAQAVPGMGVLFTLFGLTVVGAAAGNLIGRFVVDTADQFIGNLPVVRSIYGGAKQVLQQVAAPERTSFQRAVMVEFPLPRCWAIGFVTNEDTAETAHDTGEPLVTVFVPHVPLPTSGFLLYLPASALRPMSMTPEEALKRILSLGIVHAPEPELPLPAPKPETASTTQS
jgi:uncharacterized membrane protein